MPLGIQPGASTSAQGLDEPSPTELPMGVAMGGAMGGASNGPGPSTRASPNLPVRPQFHHPGVPPHFPLFYQQHHHPFMAAPPPYQLAGPSHEPAETAIRTFKMPAVVNARFKMPLLDSTDTETEAEPAETESEDMEEDTEDTEDTEDED